MAKQWISNEIIAGTYTRARIVVDETIIDNVNNTSTISVRVQMWRTNQGYETWGSGTLYIWIDGYGWVSSQITTNQIVTYNSYTQIGDTRTQVVTHNSSGEWTGSIRAYSISGISNLEFDETSMNVTLTRTPVYRLSISEGLGSSITVQRTSAGGNTSTGILSSGSSLSKGDILKITFAAKNNYMLLTHTVNSNVFSSESSYTVDSDVSVAATAQVLASDVAAINADIGSVSTIIVTKYNNSYVHSLHYSFGSLSGYITASGDVSNTEIKFDAVNIPFKIPIAFFNQIPTSKTGVCTITCRTYDSMGSSTLLGSAKSCTFIATAKGSPIVSGTVVDTNSATVALTGNSSKLVRYLSTPLATITAYAQNGSSIVLKSINNTFVDSSSITFENASDLSYSFNAVDSRGYTSTDILYPDIVPYIPLTINALLSRPAPTTGEIVISFSGNYFNGSFGASQNSIFIKYRYRESNSTSWSEWVTIPQSNYSIGESSYFTPEPISLGTSYNYLNSYVFQVKVEDGTSQNILSTVQTEHTVYKGIPVFDWGEKDFKFNVPVTFSGGVNITAAQVGAAPDGFGLGTNANTFSAAQKPAIADFAQTGWYRYAWDVSDNPFYGYGGLVRVEACDICIIQTVYVSALSSDGNFNSVARRQKPSGESSFTAWEYENPPMRLGVEYKTTERYLGYPVYKKVIDFGALPNSTTKSVEHGISNLKQGIRYDIVGTNDNTVFSFYPQIKNVYNGGTTINVVTDSNMSAYTVNIIFSYIKN